MGNKKSTRRVTSIISSKSNPAASSNTHTASKSSIYQSAFCPSQFQLYLFASVIQGFDAQLLRIHSTVTGRLQCEHTIEPKVSITCLAWGYDGEKGRKRSQQESKKKRKRSELVNGDQADAEGREVVIAFGTTNSDIHLYSPAEAKITSTLKSGHTQGIRQFKFADNGLHGEGWSIGGDGRLVHWDLTEGKMIRSTLLFHGPASALSPVASSVICATHKAYIFDPTSQDNSLVYNASTNNVHTIISPAYDSSRRILFLTAAEHDHFMNVFGTDDTTSIGSLRTECEVLSLDLWSNESASQRAVSKESLDVRLARPEKALLVVDKDGALEIFTEPFDFGNASTETGLSIKERVRLRTRKATARVIVKRPGNDPAVVPLIGASFQGSHIALVWVEGGVQLAFEKVQWRDEASGNLLLHETTELFKAKTGAGVGATVMNGVKDMGKSHVDESHTVIVNGEAADGQNREPDIVSISSAEEESEFEEDGPAMPPESVTAPTDKQIRPHCEDVEMADAGAGANEGADEEKGDRPLGKDGEEHEEPDEPSFGDLMRTNASKAVNVQAEFADPNMQSPASAGDKSLHQLPSEMSLGTVLTQSLRTNDTNLLETCFHVKDLTTVRATIERLESSFANILLQRLAERLHSRPGRAGSLMVWIQWTLVAHGGYLAGQPEVVKKLASLHRVVRDRANSLQPLLSLKGKLDMLEAQMNLRKSMQARFKAANALEEDDEEDVIYVEGQEDLDAEVEDVEADPSMAGANDVGPNEGSDNEVDSEEDEESEDQMPTTRNGILAESEDDESDDEGLFDEEASETDNDSDDDLAEDDIDHDSVDSVDSSDADASPPPKRAAKSKLSNGIASRKR